MSTSDDAKTAGPAASLRGRALFCLTYLLVPILLLVILYGTFFPMDTAYIGETHDILSNSLYYTLLQQDPLACWNNLWAGGFPLTAGPGSDRYYPLSVPFYLVFHNLTTVNYLILLHIVIAYLAFFVFGTLFTRRYPLVMIFSLFFAFSGVIFGRIGTGHHLLLYGIAWIPLLYYFFFKMAVFERPTLPDAAGMSVVSVLIYFTGNVYHFVYAYLLLLVFCLWYAVSGRLSRKVICYLLLSLVLTGLLCSVKAIPDLNVSGSIVRVDAIDPVKGGGTLETDIASFVAGTPVTTDYSREETTVMVGVIPVLLMILGLVYGRKEIAVPSYCAALFAIIWAGADKSVFAILHFLPIVSSFRVPGRIFGALLPLVLALALYGVVLVSEKLRNGESFELSEDQKRWVLYGVAGVLAVKLLELPFYSGISTVSVVSLALVAGFAVLLYTRYATFRNIALYCGAAIAINAALILWTAALPSAENLGKLLVIGLLIAGYFACTLKSTKKTAGMPALCGIVLVALFLVFAGNIGYVKTFDPGISSSPAIGVTNAIRTNGSANAQTWVYENGWAFQHMDFTYWDVARGLHPMNLYLPYYLVTMPRPEYSLGGVNYSAADYYVDTLSLENGEANLPATFTVGNVTVYRPEHVLPTVFIVRNDTPVPLTVDKFSSGTVVASGPMKAGDVVVYKAAYYPGWKANGADAVPVANMVGTRLTGDTGTITFTFDPADFKIGAALTLLGLIALAFLLVKRKETEAFIARFSVSQEAAESGKGKKKGKRNKP